MEDGYYWVRMFNKDADPTIVLYKQWGGVFVFGSTKRYSDYYDVAEWLGKVSEFSP